MGKLKQLVRTRESFFEKIGGMSHSSKKAKKFANRSHGFEYAVSILKEEY